MFRPEILALLIPITALMIPIVAILVSHQQKMARIIHGEGGANTRAQIDALRAEVAQLKEVIHQQTIALDNLANRPIAPPTTNDVAERLQQA